MSTPIQALIVPHHCICFAPITQRQRESMLYLNTILCNGASASCCQHCHDDMTNEGENCMQNVMLHPPCVRETHLMRREQTNLTGWSAHMPHPLFLR